MSSHVLPLSLNANYTISASSSSTDFMNYNIHSASDSPKDINGAANHNIIHFLNPGDDDDDNKSDSRRYRRFVCPNYPGDDRDSPRCNAYRSDRPGLFLRTSNVIIHDSSPPSRTTHQQNIDQKATVTMAEHASTAQSHSDLLEHERSYGMPHPHHESHSADLDILNMSHSSGFRSSSMSTVHSVAASGPILGISGSSGLKQRRLAPSTATVHGAVMVPSTNLSGSEMPHTAEFRRSSTSTGHRGAMASSPNLFRQTSLPPMNVLSRLAMEEAASQTPLYVDSNMAQTTSLQAMPNRLYADISNGLVRHSSSPAGVLSDLANDEFSYRAEKVSMSSLSNLSANAREQLDARKKGRRDDTKASSSTSHNNLHLGLVYGNSCESLAQFSIHGTSNTNDLAMDLILCKSRAKRGCATHPRSVAERVRRTKISERMRKLQDLVPNLDKQAQIADMLDEVAEYVKNLQQQVQDLSKNRCRCDPTTRNQADMTSLRM